MEATVMPSAEVAPRAQVGAGTTVWHLARIRKRAELGEGCVVGQGAYVDVGRWALVGAGAVVTRDVPDHALVVGVPARRVGWVGRVGVPLVPDGDGAWRCSQDGTRYAEEHGRLVAR